MIRDELLHPAGEVGLKTGVIFNVVLLHVLFDTRIRVPLLTVALISADVEVGIWKERGHLTDELVKKLIGPLTGGIHRRIEDSPVAFDLVGSAAAREVG